MSIEQYLVDVIGFDPTERTMLESVFALAARRDPRIGQYDPAASAGGKADLYLVDADNAQAMEEFRTIRKRASLPAVLIGAAPAGSGNVVLPRPMQWARLLQALEEAVAQADARAAEPAPAAEAPRRSGSVVILGRPRTDKDAARKRALGDTVLVVDDNATVRAFMKAKLAPFGFEVDFAGSGEEAVGLAGAREYTCVFLDVVLPGIDGYHVCKQIKTNRDAMRKTAVVMLTSRSSPFDKLRGSLAGCDEYLTKPLDEDRLLEVIARFLPSSRRRDRARRSA